MSKVNLADMGKDDLVVLVKRLNGQIKFLQQQGAPAGVVVGPNGVVSNSNTAADTHHHQVAELSATIKQLKQENSELNMRLKSSQETAILLREELSAKTAETSALSRQLSILSDQLVESQQTVEDLLKQQQVQQEEFALKMQLQSAAQTAQQAISTQSGNGANNRTASSISTAGSSPPPSLRSPEPQGPAAGRIIGGGSNSHTAVITETISALQTRITELEETLDFYATIVQAQDKGGEVSSALLLRSGGGGKGNLSDENFFSTSQSTEVNPNEQAMFSHDADSQAKEITHMRSDEKRTSKLRGADYFKQVQREREEQARLFVAYQKSVDSDIANYKRLIQSLYEEVTIVRNERDGLRLASNKLTKRMEVLDGLVYFAARPSYSASLNAILCDDVKKRTDEAIDANNGGGDGNNALSPNPKNETALHSSQHANHHHHRQQQRQQASSNRSASVEQQPNGTAATIIDGGGGFQVSRATRQSLANHNNTQRRPSFASATTTRASTATSATATTTRASLFGGGGSVGVRDSFTGEFIDENATHVVAGPSFFKSLFGAIPTTLGYGGGGGGAAASNPITTTLLGRGRTGSHGPPVPPSPAASSDGGGHQSHHNNHNANASSSNFPQLDWGALPDKSVFENAKPGSLTSREQKLLDRTNAVEAFVAEMLAFDESRRRNYEELDANRAELFASLNEKLQTHKDEIVRLTKEVKSLTTVNKVMSTARAQLSGANSGGVASVGGDGAAVIDGRGPSASPTRVANSPLPAAAAVKAVVMVDVATNTQSDDDRSIGMGATADKSSAEDNPRREEAERSSTVCATADSEEAIASARLQQYEAEAAETKRRLEQLEALLADEHTAHEAALTEAVKEAAQRGKFEGVAIAKGAAKAAVGSQKLQFESAASRYEGYVEFVEGCVEALQQLVAASQFELIYVKSELDAFKSMSYKFADASAAAANVVESHNNSSTAVSCCTVEESAAMKESAAQAEREINALKVALDAAQCQLAAAEATQTELRAQVEALMVEKDEMQMKHQRQLSDAVKHEIPVATEENQSHCRDEMPIKTSGTSDEYPLLFEEQKHTITQQAERIHVLEAQLAALSSSSSPSVNAQNTTTTTTVSSSTMTANLCTDSRLKNLSQLTDRFVTAYAAMDTQFVVQQSEEDMIHAEGSSGFNNDDEEEDKRLSIVRQFTNAVVAALGQEQQQIRHQPPSLVVSPLTQRGETLEVIGADGEVGKEGSILPPSLPPPASAIECTLPPIADDEAASPSFELQGIPIQQASPTAPFAENGDEVKEEERRGETHAAENEMEQHLADKCPVIGGDTELATGEETRKDDSPNSASADHFSPLAAEDNPSAHAICFSPPPTKLADDAAVVEQSIIVEGAVVSDAEADHQRGECAEEVTQLNAANPPVHQHHDDDTPEPYVYRDNTDARRKQPHQQRAEEPKRAATSLMLKDEDKDDFFGEPVASPPPLSAHTGSNMNITVASTMVPQSVNSTVAAAIPSRLKISLASFTTPPAADQNGLRDEHAGTQTAIAPAPQTAAAADDDVHGFVSAPSPPLATATSSHTVQSNMMSYEPPSDLFTSAQYAVQYGVVDGNRHNEQTAEVTASQHPIAAIVGPAASPAADDDWFAAATVATSARIIGGSVAPPPPASTASDFFDPFA